MFWKLAVAMTLLAIGDMSPVQDPLRLEIQPLRAKLGTHDTLEVEVRVINLSDEPLTVIIPFSWPNGFLLFEVIRPDGIRAENVNSAYPDDPPEAFARCWTATIPPRSFVGHRLRVSATPGAELPGFLFVEPGEYQILARLLAFRTDTGEGMTLQSNTASVEVTP